MKFQSETPLAPSLTPNLALQNGCEVPVCFGLRLLGCLAQSQVVGMYWRFHWWAAAGVGVFGLTKFVHFKNRS